MEGETLVRLAAAMERQPHVGVIQTIPIVVGGVTLFARLQQFAGRVYGPLIANGLAWWNGADGNYWGHNAIVRTVAFAEAAGLPHLKGPKPFGGHVLSHDFVEAALVRRGGWAVRLAPALSGSYEESPPVDRRSRHPRSALVSGQSAAPRRRHRPAAFDRSAGCTSSPASSPTSHRRCGWPSSSSASSCPCRPGS